MTSLSYFYVFLQSNLLELPIYAAMYILVFKNQVSLAKVLIFSTLCNSLTHPIVFHLIMTTKMSYLTNILIAESFAIGAETFLHAYAFKFKIRPCFMASLLANLVSWQIAPLLTYLVVY